MFGGSSKQEEEEELLARLLQQAEPAPFGEGNQKCLNETIRKTLQIVPDDDDDSTFQPLWDGLQEALSEISQALTPGIRLEAELHKILIYRPGYFFAEHCDSKKSANHTMTLSVLCGGYGPVGRGAVCFLNPNNDDDAEEDDTMSSYRDFAYNKNCWETDEPGSFACWFNTEPHRVMPVQNGYRVVLQYNVGVVERVSELSQVIQSSSALAGQSRRIYPRSWLMEFSKILPDSEERPEEFWRSDESHPYNLFVQFLQKEKQNILDAIETESFGRSKLGLLLKHEYSLDGKLHVPRLHLRGSDAWLGTAMDEVFGTNRWTTRRAVLWTTVNQNDYPLDEEKAEDHWPLQEAKAPRNSQELLAILHYVQHVIQEAEDHWPLQEAKAPWNLHDAYDRKSLLEFSVFQDITSNRIGNPDRDSESPFLSEEHFSETFQIPKEYFHLVPSGKTSLTRKALFLLKEPTTLDRDGGKDGLVGSVESEGPFLCDKRNPDEDYNLNLFWPFFRTLFLIREGDLARVTTTRMTNGKREGWVRWGNDEQYEVFAYTTVALLLDLEEGVNDASTESSEAGDDPVLGLEWLWRNDPTEDDMVTRFVEVPEKEGVDDFDQLKFPHFLNENRS